MKNKEIVWVYVNKTRQYRIFIDFKLAHVANSETERDAFIKETKANLADDKADAKT